MRNKIQVRVGQVWRDDSGRELQVIARHHGDRWVVIHNKSYKNRSRHLKAETLNRFYTLVKQ